MNGESLDLEMLRQVWQQDEAGFKDFETKRAAELRYMSVQIKRVSYSYNSNLEDQGLPAYFFDCLVYEGGSLLVDLHESYATKDEFYSAIGDVLPLLASPEQVDSESNLRNY